MTTAKIGHKYTHCKTGAVYTVLDITRDTETHAERVIYAKPNDPHHHDRLREEFEGTHPTLGVERFTHVAAPARLSWTEYFIEMAHLISRRATCDRKHVGAVFVRDSRVISTGYNGSPPGLPHCDEVGHDIVVTDGKENCVRTVHAEQNGVYQAAQHGVSLANTVLYVNTFPCWNCAKALLSVRISKIVYDADYNNDPRVVDAFNRAGIGLEKFNR